MCLHERGGGTAAAALAPLPEHSHKEDHAHRRGSHRGPQQRPRSSLLQAQQLHLEGERGAAGDGAAGTALPVGELGGDDNCAVVSGDEGL